MERPIEVTMLFVKDEFEQVELKDRAEDMYESKKALLDSADILYCYASWYHRNASHLELKNGTLILLREPVAQLRQLILEARMHQLRENLLVKLN